MPSPATSVAEDKVTYSVRHSESFVRDLDEKRKALGDLLGFDVSRADYFAHACRQLWGHESASDDPASKGKKKGGRR